MKAVEVAPDHVVLLPSASIAAERMLAAASPATARGKKRVSSSAPSSAR
jgi:hypothetical protein